MCSLDLDPCAVWSETPRRARRAHECTACGVAIQPGEAYLSHFSVFEGCPSTEKMCFACWLARGQFAEAHGQSFPPSALLEQLHDCIGANDDEEDEWRPIYANVLARFRVSAAHRQFQRARRGARTTAEVAP